ncbi:MAG: hypothetical protein LBG22_10480 [Treponema sp.]|jgi:hypothetical protein|nr:hypothetical protein [Treponema sp.]
MTTKYTPLLKDGAEFKMYAELYDGMTRIEACNRIFARFSYTRRLSDEERTRLIQEGIAIGERQAKKIQAAYPDQGPLEIARACGISIHYDSGCQPNTHYVQFATYHAKKKEIHLNETVIKMLCLITEEHVEKIFIAHELFHYYEMTELGRIGNQFHIKRLLLGFIPVRQALLPMGEIAANVFCKSISGISFEPLILEKVYFDNIQGCSKTNRVLEQPHSPIYHQKR